MLYALVIIDISADSVDREFTYLVPPELEKSIVPGVWVIVPFGRNARKVRGRVLSVSSSTDLEKERIKPILGVMEEMSALSGDLIALSRIMADEYCCTLNQALSTVQPVTRSVRANKRRRDPAGDIGELYTGENDEFSLNCEQQKAAAEIEASDKVSLLFGVTGSGKTRVYIELIRRMAQSGRQTIVLIPEISLTYQTVGELMRYLGDRVSLMHSRLSEGERYEQFKKAENGEIDVIVGPRSAVFAPFKHLGLIIIDEEHEKSYHSDMTPTYDARFVAKKRAELTGAKLLLASATPSLESYKLALEGVYDLHTLTRRAQDSALLPRVSVVDMRRELATGERGILSRKLKNAIDKRLGAGEQVMLFLNRRGYSNFVSCRSCGEAIRCPRCDVALTVHNSWYIDPVTAKRSAKLSCHYCGFSQGMPSSCPGCGSKYLARFGVGTEQLEQSVKKIFPQARVLRMDHDTTTKKGSFERILSQMRSHKADILIGTQMIVKGHDFPLVTLVGIVAADLSLNVPDFDASERTFELITQAAGRSGRGEIEGEVIIQSYEPEHYAITSAAMQDFPGFFERELSYRRLMNYPPEVSMLFLRFRSVDEALVIEASDYAALIFSSLGIEGLLVFGPVSESIYKIKDSYRKILYVKHPEHDIIKEALSKALTAIRERFGAKELFLSSRIL